MGEKSYGRGVRFKNAQKVFDLFCQSEETMYPEALRSSKV